MNYLFTSESVSAGHPDKVADQISDVIIDSYLSKDSNAKIACECLCTTDFVVVAGEVKAATYGHFGRDPYVKDGLLYFGWERLDMVEQIKNKLLKNR